MMDKDAIKELAKAEAINASSDAVALAIATGDEGNRGAAALPGDFNLHDLEKFMPNRRRLRGSMATAVVADFSRYVAKNAEKGAAIFVEQERMTACAVLNLGTPDKPGHADNIATLQPKRTAAYAALREIATGNAFKQADVAEFLEDWADRITCFKDGIPVVNAQAVAAIRKLTIEAMRKIESSEQQFSASRSALESVEAKSEAPLPTAIIFTCEPYSDLTMREFTLRLGILTGGDKPMLNLRIIKMEEHAEKMAEELAEVIRKESTTVPVMQGSYSAK